MRTGRLLLYLLAAVGALVVVSAVVSVILAVLALLWAVVTTAMTLAVLAGIGYGVYRLYGLTSSSGTTDGRIGGRSRTRATERLDSSDVTSAGEVEPTDPVERAKQRYAAGELSEQELERRLELELDDGDSGRADRQPSRERR